MKTLYSIIILLLLQAVCLAQIPCRFTWQDIKLPNGSTENYTSPQIEEQPYQGPCLAFALVATLESQYEIDHNRPSRNLDLSEAYVDYKVYNWTNANLQGVFDNAFSIPEQVAGNFSERCTNELDCPLLSDVRGCINNNQCFNILDLYSEKSQTWVQQVNCVSCPTTMKRALGQEVLKINNSISSIDKFKELLMFEGPMILRLNGPTVANQLHSYGSTGYIFHAVSVIGWKEVNGGIKLHFKDSWPGGAGFKYSQTLSHAQLFSLINQGEAVNVGFELFQIRNSHVIGERSPLINYSFFAPQDQCTPIPLPTPNLVLVGNPVIKRNEQRTLYASVNCLGEAAIDWEWYIPNSSVHTPVKNSCNSTVVFSTNTQAGSIQVKVRAKSSSGAWSAWRTRTFIVDNNLN